MKKRIILKTIVFIFIFGLILTKLTDIFVGKWLGGTNSTYVQQGIYELEDDSIDVCFLGNSQMSVGISSMKLLEQYGISAYSGATALQPMLCSYFNLKELDKKQDFSLLVLEMASLFEVDGESQNRTVWDNAPLSKNKVENLRMYMNEKDIDGIWSYIFPIIKYHTRWNELTRTDFAYKGMNTETFRGNSFSENVFEDLVYEDFIVDHDELDDSVEVSEYQLKYFLDIVEYCEKNNIELLLMKTPKSEWNKSKMLKVQELADEYGLEYLDFNEAKLFDTVGFDLEQDFMDPDHVNIRGALKLTEYLGEYLVSEYEFEDVRASEKNDKEMLADFHKDVSYKMLVSARHVEDILKSMSDDRYEILLQKNGEISEQWTAELQEIYEEIGFRENLSDLHGKNYVAHLADGNVIHEEAGLSPITYETRMKDNRKVVLQSGNEDASDMVSVPIGSKDVKITNGGLSIVIYDTELRRIVRYFSIGYDEKADELVIWQKR